MKKLKDSAKTVLYQDGNLFKVYVKGAGQPRIVMQTSNAGTASKAFDFYDLNPDGKYVI